MEDEIIIDMYFRRSLEAITQTELKYGKQCKAVSYNILGNVEDSEECLNDTLFAAWNEIPPVHPLHLGAYIVGISRKLSLSRLRSRCADKRGGGEYALSFDELESCFGKYSSPQLQIEMRELAQEIHNFINSLSADDRKIFMCRYWLIASVAQISEGSGFSESKIKSSLHRSRTKLKKHLIKEGLL